MECWAQIMWAYHEATNERIESVWRHLEQVNFKWALEYEIKHRFELVSHTCAVVRELQFGREYVIAYGYETFQTESNNFDTGTANQAIFDWAYESGEEFNGSC